VDKDVEELVGLEEIKQAIAKFYSENEDNKVQLVNKLIVDISYDIFVTELLELP